MSDMRYINRKVLEALKPMGRIDGDMATNSVDAASAAQTWRRECELLRNALAVSDRDGKFMAQKLEEAMCRIRFIESCDADEVRELKAKVAQYETQLKAGRQCVAERDEEIERLKADSVAEFDSQARRDLVNENDMLRCVIKHLSELL